tara:strand:- start:9187 stop:9690 length:504 start_codon:yes stop_codon:yes gene_type:complete
MSSSKQPTFIVSAYSEPVFIRIHGKANYLNCNNFREFMENMLRAKKQRFAIDFTHCTGMDSTFLGILAGVALDLREQSQPGTLLVCSLSERNRELICNLGLQALLSIDTQIALTEQDGQETPLENTEVSSARRVLEAHQNLIQANSQNAAKFQDVVAFLKNQLSSNA